MSSLLFPPLEYRRKKKNSSTATPSKLTTTSDLDTTTAAKSTQRTPLNKITNFTTASVPVTNAVNTTEEPYTDKMVGLSSKEHMVTENIITPKPVPVNSTQPAAHAKTPVVTGHSLLPPAVVLQHSRREPVGIWSTLVVWFLFMQGEDLGTRGGAFRQGGIITRWLRGGDHIDAYVMTLLLFCGFNPFTAKGEFDQR